MGSNTIYQTLIKIKLHIATFIVVFACLAFSGNIYAQAPEPFPEDSTKFFNEIEKFFKDTKKSEARQLIKAFEEIWFGGNFTDEERKPVYAMCNRMLEERFLPFPEFENYLQSVMQFKITQKQNYIYENWHIAINQLLNESKRKYSAFLKFSVALFEDNALYRSNTNTWKSSNGDFIISIINNEPVIQFPSLDLYCLSKNDTAVIYGTQGEFYPLKNEWQGRHGIVDWSRAGFDVEKVFAELQNYKIDTRHPYYKADSVKFRNPEYFGDAILMGNLEEKILANITPEKATYPRFTSYNKRLVIKNIVPGIDYDGGFSQEGGKFVGKGTEEENAKLIFYRENLPFLQALSTSFIIRNDRITTQRARIKIYLETDSIYHPGVQFQFLTNERLLSLVRTGEDITKSPYYNSYHNIDMRFESLHWKVDDPIITMEALFGSTNRSALFESLLYFKEDRYDMLYRIDDVHPLVRVKRCAEKYDRNDLSLSECSSCFGQSQTSTKILLLELSNFGYINYDFTNNRIMVTDKLYNYVYGKSGRRDYDVLQFNSQPEKGHNAKLNLLNNELTIAGIYAVLLSDSHLVYIYPQNQEIVLQKGLNFKFKGIVNAGNFEIFGQENQFLYDEFKFDLPNIDSIRIYVDDKKANEFGRKKQIRVKTVLEDVKGVLEIDSPGNKSGLKKLHRYPVFTSQKESYAYYDSPRIQGGVYKRDNFGFQLQPFVLDSLDNFNDKTLHFDGTFESAGIFPEFDETLKLQEDNSLGFIRPTPPEGYEVYGGKGKFLNNISLSNKGLRGDGYLEYLTATAQSKSFYFHPDSLFGIADNFVIEEQIGTVEYPPVTGTNIFINWQPYKDYLTATTNKEPLRFYDGQSKFFGKITYSPNELRGAGRYEFKEAEIFSKDYLFKFKEFFNDTADFRLRSFDDNSLTFNTSNVKAHVDFQSRKALFISNGGSTTISLPENQYIARMDRFTWFMDNDDIELSGGKVTEEQAKKGVSLEGSKFTSVHPKQDSLSFYSPSARFNHKTKVIRASEVQVIPVGDAYIYPDSGKVTIRAQANMEQLKNARILANTITEYHNIYNATLKINGRLNYSGNGKIDYVDENKLTQVIELDKVYLDTTFQTVGSGLIPLEQDFSLSPNYNYFGNVRLEASKPLLTFSGYAKIFHTCTDLPINWLQFSSQIDPTEIYIPIDSISRNDENDLLTNGILLTTEPYEPYGTFLSEVIKPTDVNIFNSKGFLFYDKPAQSYLISNLEKINQKSLPGSYLVLNKNNCNIEGEGKFNLGANLGRIENSPSGQIIYNPIGDSLVMNFVWLLDFYFDKKAIKIMSDEFQKFTDLPRVDFDRAIFKRSIQELIGKEETDRVISELSLYQKYRRFPRDLDKTLFINDIKMVWNNESESYQSVGKIGIGNIEKEELNRYVNGKIEIVKKRSGDEITIYFELDRKTWYYFNYRAEVMQAVSSNQEFNTAVKEAKKNKLEKEKGKDRYRYILASESRKIQFIKKFDEF